MGSEMCIRDSPFVLETVSLDLYLARQLGFLLRRTPLTSRLDVVELIDEFAPNFYSELDYNLECANGERIRADMARLPRVVIPKNYPALTTRRVHVAEWVYGEKLSQARARRIHAVALLASPAPSSSPPLLHPPRLSAHAVQR